MINATQQKVESVTDEPPQRETEIQDGDKQVPGDGKDVQAKGLLRTSQTNRRSISPLTLFKEDLSQFKDEVFKVFKDKDANPKASQPAEKSINTLTLLREDLNQLRDDLSSVFRSSMVRDEKDAAAKEDSSNGFKIKASTDEPLMSLFRRDRSLFRTFQRAEDVREVKKTLSEKREDAVDDGSKGDFSGQTEETVDVDDNNVEDTVNELQDNELDVNVSEEKTETTKSVSETQQREETICPSNTASVSPADQRGERDEENDDSSAASRDEEEEPSESLPWDTLSSGITLFSLRDANKDDTRIQPGGDLWSLKNFACYLTLDPKTANTELRMTDGNRKATRIWMGRRTSYHPERFENCPQVLCREGLLDVVYWEVVWSGGADIGVTYNNISRDGDPASCLLGHNELSWSLECSEGSYTPCHNQKRFKSSLPEPFTHRVGVYLNCSAGSLSFYCVSQHAMVHLHTFTSSFTEPLYPGFWVWAYNGSVSLCQVALDWERLLQ